MNLARLHEQALSKYASVKGRLDRHREHIATGVMRLVGTAEAAAGGATAAAIDYYMNGQPKAGVSSAMVGPVPVVAASALVGTGVAILAGKEEWAGHLANFSAGLGAASAYAETLQFLQAMPASKTA
jgi:hypothetical protein